MAETSLAGLALLPLGPRINTAMMQAAGIPQLLPNPATTFEVVRRLQGVLGPAIAWIISAGMMAATVVYVSYLVMSATCLVSERGLRLVDNAIVDIHPEQIGKSLRKSSKSGVMRWGSELVLFPFETVVVLVRGVLKTLLILFVWGPPLVVVIVITYSAIHVEMSPPEMAEGAVTTVDALIFGYHAAAVPINIGLDGSTAAFLPLFNTNVVNGVALIRLIYENVIKELINADGDFSTNSGANPDAYRDNLKESVTHLNGVEGLIGNTNQFGRRLSDNTTLPYNIPEELYDVWPILATHAPVASRERRRNMASSNPFAPEYADGQYLNLKPLWNVVHLVMNTLTLLLDLYYRVQLIILEIVLILIRPVIEFVGDIIANIMMILGCGALDPVCFLRQMAQLFITGLIAFANLIIRGFNLGISFGSSETGPLGLIPDNNVVGCKGGEFNSAVRCNCAGNLFEFKGGIFPGVEECGPVTYMCDDSLVPSTGHFTEYRIEGASKTALLSSTSRDDACKHSRRALTAAGSLENMEAHGLYGCYHVCLHGEVLVELCPLDVHATLVPKELDADPHVLVYKGVCEDHHHAGPGPRRHLAAMPHSSVSSYVKSLFTSAPHTTVATVDERARKEQDVKHARERAHTEAHVSRASFEKLIWTTIEDSQSDNPTTTTFEGKNFECSFPRVMDPKSDNVATRYTDQLCMLELASLSSKANTVTESSYVASAATAWMNRAGVATSGRRLADETNAQRARRMRAEGLVGLAEIVRVRVAKMKMLMHHPGTLAERIDILTQPSESMDAVHRRLQASATRGDASGGTTFWQNSWQHSSAILERGHANLLEMTALMSDHAPATHRRNLAAATTNNGIFRPRLVCGATQISCADGKTCVERVNRASCPYPEQWSASVYVKHALHMMRLSVGSLDPLTWVQDAFACWESYETNDETNPYSISNRYTPHDDPKLRWCPLLVRDVPFRFPAVKFNLARSISESCTDNGCDCDNYITGQWRMDVEAIHDVPYFIYARVYNALVGARWALAQMTEGSSIDTAWKHVFGPFTRVLPVWVPNLFNTTGYFGTYQQQLLCFWFHFGSFMYVFFMVCVFTILYVGMGGAVSYVMWRIYMLADYFVSLAIERAFKENAHESRLVDENDKLAGLMGHDDHGKLGGSVARLERKERVKASVARASLTLRSAFFAHVAEREKLNRAIDERLLPANLEALVRRAVDAAVADALKNS